MPKGRKRNKNDPKDLPFELGEVDFYRLNQIRKYSGVLLSKEEKFSSGITGDEKVESFKNFPHKKKVPRDLDQIIFEKISNILAENEIIPMEEVIFSVRNGVVSLSGRVSDREKIKKIERSIRRIPGVQKMINEILVSSLNHEWTDDYFFNP